MREILFRSSVSYEELAKIVTEIAGIINWRPLTYIYNDNRKKIVIHGHLIYVGRLLSKPINWKLGKTARLIKGHKERIRAATVKICNNNFIPQLINRVICKLYSLKTRANENIEKYQIIADQTIFDNDMTSLYELSERPNRLAGDISTLIRRISGQV